MAKRLHEEDIKLNIIVGNNQAQKRIYDLETATRKLKDEQKLLLSEKYKLERQNKKESTEYKEITARLRVLKKEISANASEMKGLVNQLGVTGLTMDQLKRKASSLRAQLAHMIPGSAQYNALQKDLQAVSARMSELNGRARAQGLTWSSAANWLNKYQTLLISVTATLTGVVFTFQKWLDYAGELSDQQANVMKTTAMTKQEVDELTKSFGALETRTSRIDLLKIAEEGGRIGIAKDQMADFVQVMDKANVALGDSFTGGVEEVSSVLGKLKFLFEETKDLGVDLAYNAIGSAINDLGADGVATEKNIAEFATRLGSLPNQLKPTIAEALALGAAFEESGIEAEVSARAYSIFLKQATDPGKMGEFARVMGVSTEEMRKMIDADPVEFFLKFGEQLGKSRISASQMSQMLQDMGINADGANKIVGAISNNSARFRAQIDLSNKSMSAATSLTNEFNTKNETLAATLEKIQKTVAGWMSSDTLMKWLEDCVIWFAKLIGATDDADGSGKKWREGLILAAKVLTILIVGIGSYNAGMKMYTLWTARATAGSLLWNIQMRIQNALAAISIIRTGLMTAANALFTQGIRAAIVQIRLMNAVLGLSPWGALAAAIGLVVSALVLFGNESDRAIGKQKLLNSINAEAEKSIAGQRKEIELLMKVAKDENLEKEKRIKAINRLNEIIPGYNHLLNLEKINTLEATAATKAYTEMLLENAKAKALQSKFDSLESEKLDVEQTTSRDYESGGQSRSRRFWEMFGVEQMEFGSRAEVEKYVRANYKNLSEAEVRNVINTYLADTGILQKESKIDEITKNQEIISAELYALMKKNPGALSDGSGLIDLPTSPVDSKDTKSKVDKSKSEAQKRLDELKAEQLKLQEELLKIQQQTEDAQLEIMEEGFQKEQAQLQTEHGRRIADLKKQIVDASTIAKLEQERANASKSGDAQKAGLLDQVITNIKLKNTELENAITQATITYEYKRGLIHTKFAQQRLSDLQKEYDEQKKLRNSAYLQEVVELGSTEAIKERLRGSLSERELAQIKTWEDAKAALKRQYDQEDIEAEIQHAKDLLAEMQTALESGNFGGFDLDLLSDEDRENFIANIEAVKQKLIELGVAKADLQNGGSDSMSGGMETYGMGGQTDILGMTPENWAKFITDIQDCKFELGELTAVVGLLQNAFATYYSYIQANEQRNMALFDQNTNRKRNALKRQLDQGIISQENYDRKLQKLEEEADKRRAMMEYEAAMRAWRMQLANAMVSAAMATLNGFNTQPFMPTGLIMGALAATLGTIQVATVHKNKPVKGYEQGLYPVIREQDGKYFDAEHGGETRSGIVSKPTVFLAGENGPEMIIDNLAFRRFSPELKQDLYREIARVKGFERGYYPENESTSSNNEVKKLLEQNNVLMAQNIAVMERLMEHEPKAYIVPDFPQMRNWKKVEDDYNLHQSKNKA